MTKLVLLVVCSLVLCAGGVVASYDFLSLRSEEKISAFHIKPRLGLGYRW